MTSLKEEACLVSTSYHITTSFDQGSFDSHTIMNSGLANSSIPDIDSANRIHNIANFVLAGCNCITESSTQNSRSCFADNLDYSDFHRFELIGTDCSGSFDYCIRVDNLGLHHTIRHSFGHILVYFHILKLRVSRNFDPYFGIHNCCSCFGSIGLDSFVNHSSTDCSTVDHSSADFSFVVIVHIADYTVLMDCMLVIQSCCYLAL